MSTFGKMGDSKISVLFRNPEVTVRWVRQLLGTNDAALGMGHPLW